MSMPLQPYAVIGNPIAHSKSPIIHGLFAEQTGEPVSYEALLAPVDDFASSVDTFRAHGGRGMNVTVPFKQDAWAYANQHSDRAKIAGAVNTLLFQEDGQCLGDNTDGVGLVNDLINNHDLKLAGSRILLLGAGGAVRGVLQPLLGAGPAQLLIANRTTQRALDLASSFSEFGAVSGCGLDQLNDQITSGGFDLVINGTSASLQGKLPPLPDRLLADNASIYDMMYSAEPTAFVAWGKNRGAVKSIDGLGMLVEQAAESFYLWRGVRPATRPVIKALRKELHGV
ncbi:MAG TPA: shikimate dehydrogenase [Gammaproteobacteria bacterium]|nr:shikimate dehydrogenase [Gammaproteobacteria bacterium]